MRPHMEWHSDPKKLSFGDPHGDYRGAEGSVGPRGLFWLFFQPHRFFSSERILAKRPYLYLVMYLYGLARTIDRVESRIWQSEISGRESRVQLFEESGLLDSWSFYWLIMLFAAAVGTVFVWWMGVWWYGLRIRWSGVKERNTRHVQAVFGYSSLVMSLPVIAFAAGQTVMYANYRQAYDSDGPWWTLLLLISPFWASLVGYVGVSTVFPVSVWKARLWFWILPWSLYLTGIVVLGILAVLGPEGMQ